MTSTKAERRALRAQVAAYHSEELLKLADRLRDALQQLEAGAIDAFDFDDRVHRFHRSSQKLSPRAAYVWRCPGPFRRTP